MAQCDMPTRVKTLDFLYFSPDILRDESFWVEENLKFVGHVITHNFQYLNIFLLSSGYSPTKIQNSEPIKQA